MAAAVDGIPPPPRSQCLQLMQERRASGRAKRSRALRCRKRVRPECHCERLGARPAGSMVDKREFGNQGSKSLTRMGRARQRRSRRGDMAFKRKLRALFNRDRPL